MLVTHSLRVTAVSLLVFIVLSCLSATAYAQTKPKRTDVGGTAPNSILGSATASSITTTVCTAMSSLSFALPTQRARHARLR
jgi:hypothetical protein